MVEAFLASRGFSVGAVDGIFTEETGWAIEVYQRLLNLPITGRIDENLLGHILAKNSGVPLKKTGNRGSEQRKEKARTIRQVQAYLKELGYYSSSIDGVPGPKTDLGLRLFQLDEGLMADGRIDKANLSRLKTAASAELNIPDTDTVLVLDIQKGLQRLGYFDGKGDGTYDVSTRRAIVRFYELSDIRDKRTLPSADLLRSIRARLDEQPEQVALVAAQQSERDLRQAMAQLPDFVQIAKAISYDQRFEVEKDIENTQRILRAAHSGLEQVESELGDIFIAKTKVCDLSDASISGLKVAVSGTEGDLEAGLNTILDKINYRINRISELYDLTDSLRIKNLLEDQKKSLLSHLVYMKDQGVSLRGSLSDLYNISDEIKQLHLIFCKG